MAGTVLFDANQRATDEATPERLLDSDPIRDVDLREFVLRADRPSAA